MLLTWILYNPLYILANLIIYFYLCIMSLNNKFIFLLVKTKKNSKNIFKIYMGKTLNVSKRLGIGREGLKFKF